MVLEDTITSAISVEETAEKLFEKGVDLIDYQCGTKDQLPMVRFRGDGLAGSEAVEIARKLGLWPIHLHRVWTYIDGAEKRPHWRLFFHYAPEEGRFSEEEMALMVEAVSYDPVVKVLRQGPVSSGP